MKKANLPPGSPQSKVDEAEPISSREAVEFAVAFAKERRAKAQALEKRKSERRLHAQLSSKRDAGKHYHQPTKTLPKDFRTRHTHTSSPSQWRGPAASWSASGSQPSLRASLYIPAGHYTPSLYYVYSDAFTATTHMHSDNDRPRQAQRQERLRHHALQIADKDFTVRHVDSPLQGQACFSGFDYILNPYQEQPKTRESCNAPDPARIGPPLKPPGRFHHPTDLLRGRLRRLECLMELEQELALTWRRSFLQVFENRQGLIVASFDTAAAADEGHLAAYMNELASLNSLTDEWQLSKVATGWALQHAGCTHFMLRPHWVPAVRCVAPQLAGLVPSVQVEAP
eukprot:jgi/Astpho2/3050/Aster-03356